MANIPVPAKYRRLLRAATGQAGIPYEVGAEQITVESGFDPGVTSPAGAEGIAQFMPGTWSQYGHGSPFNPRDAFPAYGRFMGDLMGQEQGNLRDALAAYNAGPDNVPAGYPYADEILKKAGPDKGGKEVAYADPFAGVAGLSPGRIDQGVDFGGSGPVTAIGPGVVTYSGAGNTGWGPPWGAEPGGFIRYRLTSGPAAGRQVYVAEGVRPEVGKGDKLQAGQKIGDLTGGGIETGWASGAGTQPLSQTPQAGGIGGAGPFPTRVGQNFDQLLVATGVPASPDIKGSGSGKLPGNLPGWGGYQPSKPGGGWNFDWGNFPIIGPILQGGADTAHGLAAVAAVLEKFEHMVEWWAMPSNWFRIFAGVAGTGLVVLGVTALARPRVNLPVLGSTPVVPAGELGPAFGIASVTGGAVLLFFAFHNTGVGSWPELLNAVRDRIHGQPVPVMS